MLLTKEQKGKKQTNKNEERKDCIKYAEKKRRGVKIERVRDLLFLDAASGS